MSPRQMLRVTLVARVVVLLAMGAPILWSRDLRSLLALLGVGCVWTVAQGTAEIPRLARFADPLVEATAIGVMCGVSMHTTLAILAALCLAPFVAGLRTGLAGVAYTTSGQLVVVVVAGLVSAHEVTAQESLGVFTWSVAGVGLGFIATFVRLTAHEVHDELHPYLEAQALIRELIDISGGLQSGLDVVSLAGLALSTVRDRLPTESLGLYAPRGEVLVPLVTRGDLLETPGTEDAEDLAFASWTRTEPIVHGLDFAFPLGDATVATGRLAPSAGLGRTDIEAAVAALLDELRPTAVQLDTALLFSDFRDSATADVRRRLAREMHDGIAQDIASLGYLVDALAARPATPKQAEQFAVLRGRITAIVAEVRESVLTLRTSMGEAESLGAAISTVARHLSGSSQVPITVTVDEHAARLRPEVEAELFRITQEAMNNAIKHARCTAIEVSCVVHAPDVLITVRDDGVGLQQGRPDSYGLKIMRERARLIDAELTIDGAPGQGLTVAVQISTGSSIPRFTPTPNAERVTT